MTELETNVMLGRIEEKLKTQDASLARIEDKVDKTNGKVAEVSKWKERVMGGFWVLSITMTIIIVPLLTWAFITISHIPDNINRGIKDALASYNIDN